MGKMQSNWRREIGAMVALAIPVVLSELGWMLQSVVDTIMVGRLGPNAIAAVGLGSAVYNTPALCGLGLMLGLDTLVAQAYGRRDHDECHRWLAQGVYLAMIATVPLMLLAVAASYGYPHLKIAQEVALPSASYLRVLNLGTLPLLLYGASRRYLQAVGAPRGIVISFVVSNLFNWFGNWALISGRCGLPAMGINGSALSTVLSRLLMAVALMGFAWKYERDRGHPLFRHWAGPGLVRIQALLRLGFPAAGQVFMEMGAWNLATFSVGFLTSIDLATHQIVVNYATLTYMVPLGIASAAAVTVGHAIGAGDLHRARRAGWIGIAMGVSFMVCAAVVFLTMPRPLVALYTDEPHVLVAGCHLLAIVAAFQVFDGMQAVSTGALRGLGETKVPMYANLVGYWVMGLPLGFLLCFALHKGIFGLWIGLTVALILVASVLIVRWRRDSHRMCVEGISSVRA